MWVLVPMRVRLSMLLFKYHVPLDTWPQDKRDRRKASLASLQEPYKSILCHYALLAYAYPHICMHIF